MSNSGDNTTIDDLAGMVSKGFEHVADEISDLKKDMGEMKQNMIEMKLGLDNVNKKIDKLDFKIEEVRDTVRDLDEGQILDLQKRVQVLEKSSHSHS